MIIIKVDAKDAQRYFGGLVKKIPQAIDMASRDMVKDCRRGARYRLTTRRKMPSKRDNALWRSLQIRKRKKGLWECLQNPMIAPYGGIIEEGKKGWHFVPAPGKGMWGEGYAKRGGKIPKGGGYHFMRDAAESTRNRSKSIGEKWIKEAIKGG